MYRVVKSTPPKQTFITHGEPAASDALRLKIKQELRWNCRVPEYMEKVRRGFLEQVSHLGTHAVVVDANAAIEAVQAQIQAFVDRMLAAKK